MELVAIDLGGTNVRFAIAQIDASGSITLGEAVTLKTASYASLLTAWQAFAAQAGRPLPRAAALAVASPIGGEVLKMTNSPWVIRPRLIAGELGLDDFTIINDFGAVGHAVATLPPSCFEPLCGPACALPEDGVTTVLGPGTGLGVAYVLRRAGRAMVVETEGGHIDFAPLDLIEDRVLDFLRTRYRRVSAERIVSGPGLSNLYQALAAIENRAVPARDDAALWQAAIDGGDPLARAALERFCMCLGAVAGDLALAQGAQSVVIAGGLAQRLVGVLRQSAFSERFIAKGRFERMMAAMPVRLLTYEQPGLYGAAAAAAARHRPS